MRAPINITLGGYQGPDSVHTRALRLLGDALVRLSDGRIAVDVRTNVGEQGIKTADLRTVVERHDLDGCYLSSSYIAGDVSALRLFDIPFASLDRTATFALLDKVLEDRFQHEVEANTGLVMLGIWDNGVRHMSTANRPLHCPENCQGLKLRTLPNDDHQNVFRSLGFDPKVIDAKDLSDAVANGDVDAQENPLTNTLNFGLHKSLPTITLTGHLMGIALVLFNREVFQSWPVEIQAIVVQAVDEVSKAQRSFALEEDEACKRVLKDQGVEFIELTADQRASWWTATQSERTRIQAEIDPDLLAKFNANVCPTESVIA
ncbi:TRAP transporter substrate-binding protein [Octadecabacter sp. CECT 8868]|uniref:TRAP transporter substrate-binding protein n=1 Tax=Octadecabacter algicola TaxID=2909342 RepID=UPI001F2D1347|nr:TRAP transporter substrate-binding protein [Octadecabacter algicola]MCF2905574.1 TRAP transporter substrate-binding protein [Octadecabacter algicola]